MSVAKLIGRCPRRQSRWIHEGRRRLAEGMARYPRIARASERFPKIRLRIAGVGLAGGIGDTVLPRGLEPGAELKGMDIPRSTSWLETTPRRQHGGDRKHDDDRLADMTGRSLLRFFRRLKGVFGRLLLRYFRCADAGSFRWLWAWRVATSDAATSVAGWHTLSTVGARPNPSPHGKRQQLQSSAGSLRL
jgi:hypothetical protein